jgi:hypothetical protein
VITKEAKSKKGIFTVHQVKERYYYEIPKSELGKEFLWVTQIAKTTQGVGYGGQALGSRVVVGNATATVCSCADVNYETCRRSETPDRARRSGRQQRAPSHELPGSGRRPQGRSRHRSLATVHHRPVRVQRTPAPECHHARSSRSFVERVSAYPENIEAEASHTYTRNPTPAGAPAGTGESVHRRGMRPGSATVVLHYSMVKLPDNPMMPRLFDERVGYFTVATRLRQGRRAALPRRRFITRWRLEKKDPECRSVRTGETDRLLDRFGDTDKWIPYMKAGVEKWQKAFEAAGFKNAIIAKVAPSPKEDPDFSPEDARYSVIRWLPSTIENASGPHIHDPRTGEILDSDIQFYHNIMNLQRSWYFLQAGPLDARAQKLPLPHDLMGKLLEFVCAHEVGHTLGFQHNMKSSSMYPQERSAIASGSRRWATLRPSWTTRGSTTSRSLRTTSTLRTSFRASALMTCGPRSGATNRFAAPQRG